MITKEVSSGEIEFRVYAGSPIVSVCAVFSGQFEILLGTNIAQTTHTFLEYIRIDAHSHYPGLIATQKNSEYMTSDQTANGWINHIKEEFYSVPEIESVYFTIDETNVDIWLVIPDRDFALVRQLVDLEMQIMSKFAAHGRAAFLLEFHIVYRCGVDEDRFIPQRAIRLPQ